ncbi:uncharacterized protein LOC144018985 [Festucalex cinctus]
MTYEENKRNRMENIGDDPIVFYTKGVQQPIGCHEELSLQLLPHIKQEEEEPQPLYVKEKEKEPQLLHIKEENEDTHLTLVKEEYEAPQLTHVKEEEEAQQLTREDEDPQLQLTKEVDPNPLHVKDNSQLPCVKVEDETPQLPHVKEEEEPQPLVHIEVEDLQPLLINVKENPNPLHIKEEGSHPQIPYVKEESEDAQPPHVKVEEEIQQTTRVNGQEEEADVDCSRIGPFCDQLALQDGSSQTVDRSDSAGAGGTVLRTMNAKLIVAVYEHPELFDKFSWQYRNRAKKNEAWQVVSKAVGVPEVICRRRWKGLRDTYLKCLKESKREKEKTSSSAAEPPKKWRYSASMSFLSPFVSTKGSSGNTAHGVEENGTAENWEAEVAHEDRPEAAGPSFDRGVLLDLLPEGEKEHPSVAPSATETEHPSVAPAAIESPPLGKTTCKRSAPGLETVEEIEEHLLNYLLRQCDSSPLKPPPSEDELFLLSMIPYLRQLPPQKKRLVKDQIQKLIYDASTRKLNLDKLE